MKTMEQQRYEGARAKEVLDNEVFQQVFTDIEAEISAKWANSPARDQEGREKLWMYLSMLKKVKAQLETTLESGKLAALELEHKQSLAEKAKAMVGWPA